MSRERKTEIKEMGEENSRSNWRVMSPEIVEIGEDSKSISREDIIRDVFVAVGKNDLDVVKWAVDHAVSPGARVYLVHVYPPLTYIPTPVGKLSRSQLSKDQVKIYTTEENNRRRSLLQKYIRVCTDAKVRFTLHPENFISDTPPGKNVNPKAFLTYLLELDLQVAVETMLLESNATAKAILDLIPVVNITNLVMGTKRPPSFMRLRKGPGKGEFVQKNSPKFCEVTIVYNGKKITDGQQRQVMGDVPSSPISRQHRSEIAPQPERKFFECICFSGKFN